SEWERLTKPVDVKASWTMLNEILDGKRDHFEQEFQMLHKDGHWIDILSRANVVFDEDGKGIRVLGTHVDITERRLAEESLREKEKKFSKTFHNSPYAITITRVQDGKFIEANDAFTSITGFTREETLSDSSIGLNLCVDFHFGLA
ncbi:MAG: PAS domain S-box protein, partial [Deltaproteobacteria bacterium]|nr:PAS domain S-box protein [Deltaproteobacteria bacterium]